MGKDFVALDTIVDKGVGLAIRKLKLRRIYRRWCEIAGFHTRGRLPRDAGKPNRVDNTVMGRFSTTLLRGDYDRWNPKARDRKCAEAVALRAPARLREG